jgi:HK97 family phage prohead protease/HK97 family phage major capsid protein
MHGRTGKQKQVDPNDYDNVGEFMDDCMDEIGDSDTCQVIWDERSGDKSVKHKTRAAAKEDSGLEFILSDESVDRMDDVILADGWQLENFNKNPIALFNHRSDFPIGKWKDVRVEGKALRGYLDLAPVGTSDRIDEIRALLEAGILRAVSVGFRPIEMAEREGSKWGYTFSKQELVETSLVSVPANANALAVAKSLKISPATMNMVFAGQGTKDTIRHRRLNGGQAKSNRNNGSTTMSLSQRVAESEKRLVALREKLADHFAHVDDSNVTDEQLEVATELNEKIAQEEKTRDALVIAEKQLASTALAPEHRAVAVHGGADDHRGTAERTERARPFSMPQKKISALDFLVRAGTVQLVAHRLKKNPEDVRQLIAKDYPSYGEPATKEFITWMQRAATNPAMTTVTGWAAELVQTIFADFMETLMPKSVFPRLSAAGLSLSFGRNGKISIPTRSRTPTIAGSFVGEGLPIPVRQGAFTAQILTPKKMAVITTWTRELDEHSIPAIEGLLRQAIQEDTAVSLDSVLLDANAATVVRPAGILNGVASLPPTAGGGFNAVLGDIKAISGALLTATAGYIRNMVWIMNPQQVLSLGLTAVPGAGVFPFQAEVAAGRLAGGSIIDSGTVPMGTVIALDAADFVSVGDEAPRFEISDQATLHMEDTAPADIVAGAAPGTPATPVKSLWQTDSLALRLILPVNWTLRRPGMVAWTTGVTW